MLMASDGVKKADVNYNEAVEIPNKISREYGYGKGAVYARSITIQDVNYLTGYNPNNVGVYDPEQTGNGTKYAQGEMWEYSNKVTYHWIRSESLTYKYTTPDGILKTKTIDISNIQSNLTHVFFVMDKYEEEPAIYDDDQIIVTIKNTSFSYNMSDYISKDSNVYKLLARDSANTSYRSYCCASPSVDTDELGANFGIFEIENGNIYRGSSVSSNGDIDPYGTWICPIVILDSNVELDKVTNGVWNIK